MSSLHTLADLRCDISRQQLDDPALDHLRAFALDRGFESHRRALFAGESVNAGQQPALYTALRSPKGDALMPPSVSAQVASSLSEMADSTQSLISGRWLGSSSKPIRDIVHIGTGGSYLGPALVCSALESYGLGRIRYHYVSNVDGANLAGVLAGIHPEQTLFLVVSKSFTTQETLMNMHSARTWMLERGICQNLDRHFIAITAHPQRARGSSVNFARILNLWSWVPGRFSVWSAASLIVAAHIGMNGFDEFLEGARRVDEHFLNAPVEDNLPLLLALIDLWNGNVLGLNSQALVAYSERLKLLPAYVQQLQMESNGKRVSRTGEVLNHSTSKVLWGGVGSTDQHSYFQFLHQGTEVAAVDFVLCLDERDSLPGHQDWLISACLAQSNVLEKGNQDTSLSPHQLLPGGRPSTLIVLPALTPKTLGQLLALFEHRIFCQSILWGNNSFDQFGVDQGKQVAERVHAAITQDQPVGDSAIDRLLAIYNERKAEFLERRS